MTVRRRAIALASLLPAWVFLAGTVDAQTPAAARRPGPDTPDLKALVAKATRLSVLSDRITRSQAQRVLGVLPTRADRVLADSTAEVRRLLSELGASTAAPATRAQYQTVAKGFDEFLRASERLDVKDRNALARFARQADEVGDATDQYVELLVKEVGQPTARILSTTADLQRLTQHLAVHFLLARAGIEEREQQKEVNTGREEFAKLLDELRKSPLQNGSITGQLQLIENQWLLMNQALNQVARDMASMENACTTSERTLEVLTTLYPQYEAALKQVVGG